MNYNQILDYLYKLDSKKDWKFGLKSIKDLLKKIGNPEKELKVIHVAGTNGKGSVCVMVSSILQNKGYKVGMYTSPHLVDFKERFLINNKKISKKDLTRIYNKIRPFIAKQTYFEIITSIAFYYFNEKNVDFLVLETGLGGRLDATNVVKPLVSVITNIDLEHESYLGNTIEKIAYEKAGIIKEKVPIITGTEGKALRIIKKVALKNKAPLIKTKINKKIKLNYLKGDFQLENASIAITTINTLNKFYNLKVNKNNVKNGLKNAKWPGRFQFIGKNILVDSAHNPAAIKALVKDIKRLKYNKLIIIISIMNDKDIKSIINLLNPIADYFIVTKANNPRAAEPNSIKKYVKKPCKTVKSAKNALKMAKKTAEKGDLILVTGSIFLIGDVLK